MNEHLPCSAKNFSAGLSKLKIAVFVSKDESKNQIFEKSLFFQLLQKFEQTITVLGEKFSGSYITIENCTLCLQNIILKIKIFCWKFVSFQFFRTWNIKFLDLRQQSFHPVCQQCNLRVYMRSLRDVGIRSATTSRETFFEPWWKNFDLFLKTAFCVSKGTFWVIFFLKFLFFFQYLRNFERTFTVLGENFFDGDIKIEKRSFRLRKLIKLLNFWKFSFFSNSSELWTNNYRARQKTFRQGYQNWKLQSSSQKMNQKIKFLKILFFFNFFRILNKQLPCLAKRFSTGISKLKFAVFVS